MNKWNTISSRLDNSSYIHDHPRTAREPESESFLSPAPAALGPAPSRFADILNSDCTRLGTLLLVFVELRTNLLGIHCHWVSGTCGITNGGGFDEDGVRGWRRGNVGEGMKMERAGVFAVVK